MQLCKYKPFLIDNIIPPRYSANLSVTDIINYQF